MGISPKEVVTELTWREAFWEERLQGEQERVEPAFEPLPQPRDVSQGIDGRPTPGFKRVCPLQLELRTPSLTQLPLLVRRCGLPAPASLLLGELTQLLKYLLGGGGGMTQPPVPDSILLGWFSGKGGRESQWAKGSGRAACSSTGFKGSLEFCFIVWKKVFVPCWGEKKSYLKCGVGDLLPWNCLGRSLRIRISGLCPRPVEWDPQRVRYRNLPF